MDVKEIVEHLEQHRLALDDAIAALNGQPKTPRRRKKTMSAAARKRISIAQKRRWKALRKRAKA